MFKFTLLAGALAVATTAGASELLTNGDFETGNYNGWSANVQALSSGALTVVANNGGASPISGFSTQANPSGGRFYSITDQGGPGSYSLTQSFTLTSAARVTVSFQMFANNSTGANFANGRDYTTSPNQNAVVDLLLGGADPFTDLAADIVASFYGPGSDGNGTNPWLSYSSSLNLAAGTYTIRLAETDNQGFFQQGVDNVSVSTGAVPEPATWAMLLTGFGLAGAAMRRSRREAIA